MLDRQAIEEIALACPDCGPAAQLVGRVIKETLAYDGQYVWGH